jgi:hypothetical protein
MRNEIKGFERVNFTGWETDVVAVSNKTPKYTTNQHTHK